MGQFFKSILFFAFAVSFHNESFAQENNAETQDGVAKTAATEQAPNPVSKKYYLPTEAFSKIPFIEDPVLSPNGEYVAGLFGIGGEQKIVMISMNDNSSAPVVVAVPDQTQVNRIRWVNDDNIIASVTVLNRVQEDNWYLSRLISINRKTKAFTKLLWKLKGQNAANILWTPKDGSKEILVAAQDSIYTNDPGFWPSVYRVDVETGKSKTAVRGKSGVLEWAADHNGNVRIGVGYNDRIKTSIIYYASEGSRSFKTIDRVNLGREEDIELPFSFVPGGDTGLMFKDNADGNTGIAEVDLKTQKIVRWVHTTKEGDIQSIRTSYIDDSIIGIRKSGEDNKIEWLQPNLAAAQSELDKAAPKANVSIESYNHDYSRILAKISTPDSPGLIFSYDTKTQDLVKFASINESIGNKRLSKVKMIKYDARDGLGIEGVLTLPKGRTPKNLPFIVMPHGGPWSHDRVRYDYWAQFLANRGYAVLQPNFRGSTGYGKSFMLKGQGQMGLAMQDDITDGVSWAVQQGIADPKRVCIVGASYGGYAAMWGLVKDPDLYRCAISISGVANLRREVNDFGSAIRENLFKSQWKKMTPDFNAVSPIKSVEKIKSPLLLIHGKKDVTVDHKQSVSMNKAMQKADKDVEFVSIPLADHYFTREEDRLLLLKSMEEFLAKHNPAE